jgi:cytoskeleton protein RodZ
MTRFGDELRREREARGVGVEQICAATKVSAQNVLSLEAGEYRQLPGGVFRKGIVRSYLSALGLEETVWIERFEVSCREMGLGEESDRDWVEFAQNVKKSRSPEQSGMGLRWVGVVLLMVMLWAIAWLAWYLVQHKRLELRDRAAVSQESAGDPR